MCADLRGGRGRWKTAVEPGKSGSFNKHSGSVREYFSHSRHDFGRVVAKTHDGIRAVHRGVLKQEIVSLFSGSFAEVCQDGDVSSHDRLQRGAYIPNDAARTNNDAAYDSKVSNDSIAG